MKEILGYALLWNSIAGFWLFRHTREMRKENGMYAVLKVRTYMHLAITSAYGAVAQLILALFFTEI